MWHATGTDSALTGDTIPALARADAHTPLVVSNNNCGSSILSLHSSQFTTTATATNGYVTALKLRFRYTLSWGYYLRRAVREISGATRIQTCGIHRYNLQARAFAGACLASD